MLKKQQATPEPARPPLDLRGWPLGLLTFALALALDLWTKSWAWTALRPPAGRPVIVWEPLLELSFAHNTGAAFGLLRGLDVGGGAFAVMAALVITYTAVIVARMPQGGRLRFVALGLIVSGALGNLHDRFVRFDGLGRSGVVDFIKINYPWGGSWPNFNVADVALVVGVGLLLLGGYLGARRAARSGTEGAAS
ncbi:MAG: signal peptidase II [Nannocystaceae bacterium]|nr:signal peptidase II [Myxococcales bacterium]